MTRMIADGLQKTLSVAAAIINWRPTAGLSRRSRHCKRADRQRHDWVVVVDIPFVDLRLCSPGLDPVPLEPLRICLTYTFVISSSDNAA